MTPDVRGLVDTTPLRETLHGIFVEEDEIISGIRPNVELYRLWALSIITSHYGTGQSVVWVQGQKLRA